MKDSMGMIGAACLMGLCCGGPVLIGSLGAVSLGSILGFLSNTLLPLGSVLILGGIVYLGYRFHKSRSNQDTACCRTT